MSSYFDKYMKYKNKYLDLEKSLSNKKTHNLKGGSAFAGSNSASSVTDVSLLNQDNTNITLELDTRRISIETDFEDPQNKIKAYGLGKEYLDRWLSERSKQISRISNYLKSNPIDAVAFNDLYKWTMMPVIRRLEQIKGGDNSVIVTFGIDLRDPKFRQELLKSAELRDRIHRALKTLESRHFNKPNFKKVLVGPRASLLDEETINSICGSTEKVRTLVDAGGVRPYGAKNSRTREDNDKVTVEFYYDQTKKYKGSEQGCHFIEVTGPWHKVTWLETSLMQCVYQAKLEYDLENKNLSKEQWLYGALLRCAYSVAYTHLIQQQKPNFIPALFTNRRTGSQEFNILQNLFFADHFKQFAPPFAGGPVSKSDYHTKHFAGNNYVSLGSSSVESWNILGELGLPCLNPAGTHAHELQMVISTLFPELDRNEKGLPITQVISHYLYYKLVWERTGNVGPMPMLPDTLGTRAFMRAASYVMIDINKDKDSGVAPPVPFLSVISSARQDSGKLSDFVKIMKEFQYKGGMMASEIESTHDLLTASKLGYANFGAGGFFGDNEKVWGNPNASMNSMAVKAVRVSSSGRIGYPIKIGDPKIDGETVISNDKLSLDNNLEASDIEPIKSYAQLIRDKSYEAVVGNALIDTIFNIESGPVPSSTSRTSAGGF